MLKFASLITLATILSATASGQCKEVSSDAINAEGGGSGIFMDKRSPEERAESEVVASGGGNGIFMDKRSPEERCKTEQGFMQSGGDPKIFMGEDPEVANEFAQSGGDPKIFMQSGGNPKILKAPDSADTRDGSF